MAKVQLCTNSITLAWLITCLILCRVHSFTTSLHQNKHITQHSNNFKSTPVKMDNVDIIDTMKNQQSHPNDIDAPSQEYIIDALLSHFNSDMHSNTAHIDIQEVIDALQTKGYCHIPSVLTKEECSICLDQIWDFIQDTSGGVVIRRDNPKTWYPSTSHPVDSKNQPTIHSNEEDVDPWPHTGYSSFPDMFQSLGAGYVLGYMREWLAERIFEPLFGTRELLSSKEGFTFHRPLVVDLDEEPLIWNPYADESASEDIRKTSRLKMRPMLKVCGRPQPMSEGQHFDQGVPLSVMNHLCGKENASPSTNKKHIHKNNKYQPIQDITGLCHIQASVSFTDQSTDIENGGGHFLCYPHSHSIHHTLVGGTYRATSEDGDDRSWVPLTDDEIGRLSELGCREQRIYANIGDVILWRSDLVHAAVAPSLTRNTNGNGQITYTGPKQFRAVGYCSMLPLNAVKDYAYYSLPRRKIKDKSREQIDKILQEELDCKKFDAYRAGRTGDHRPEVESWHDHRRNTMWNSHGKTSRKPNPSFFQRPRFRLGPPELTLRQAELYGVLPYHSNNPNRDRVERAIIRGVRFATGMESETKVEQHEASIDACTARLEFLTSNLVGQDKYLGGMASPCGRYIYGVPGHAKRVIRVTVETGKVDWIGPEYIGEFKWLRGVEIPPNEKHPSCCCLALPCNSQDGCVLKIDPETSEVSTFITNELDFGDGWLYHGGNLASDGYVYAVPASARRVMKIDPIKETTEYIGPDFEGKAKWYGGILGSDGCIYGIPHNANGVLKIDPVTQEVSILAEGTLPDGQWKWHGGLASNDGTKIIGFPNNADSILVIDVPKQNVYLVGDDSILKSGTHRVPRDGRYKYLGGALTTDGHYSYLFPCDAEYVLRMDMITDELKLVGPRMTEGENKFQNGFVARDGCIYGIPQRSSGVLRIVPPGVKRYDYHGDELPCDREIVDVMYCGDEMVACKDKFEGGVLGLDGSIYCIPLRAKSFVKVVPGPALS